MGFDAFLSVNIVTRYWARYYLW